MASSMTMEDDFNEIDDFFRQNRRRRLRRILALALAIAGGYLAFQLLNPRIDQIGRMLLPPDEFAVDSPRAVFQDKQQEVASEEVSELRSAFSTRLPSYLDALRRYHKQRVRRPGATDISKLESERLRLLTDLDGSPDIRGGFASICELAEEDPGANAEAIRGAWQKLNELFASRQLPFLLSGDILSSSGVATLRLRTHEALGVDTFLKGDKAHEVRYLERLDLIHWDRDPDTLLPQPESPDVYVRAVTTAANVGLFGALTQDGYWRLTAIRPASEALLQLEKGLGKLLYDEWEPYLRESLGADNAKAMVRVSSEVARRNSLYRTINDRDTNRLTLPEPASITLGATGRKWLSALEPYAVQGRIRLKLEDIAQIKSLDDEIAGHLPPAERTIHLIVNELLRHAAIYQVERFDLRSRLEARANDERPADARSEEADIHFGGRLAQLIESPERCRVLIATLASEALSSPMGYEDTAQKLIRGLRDEADDTMDQPIPVDELPSLISDLNERSCEELSLEAKRVYEDSFGSYLGVTLQKEGK